MKIAENDQYFIRQTVAGIIAPDQTMFSEQKQDVRVSGMGRGP